MTRCPTKFRTYHLPDNERMRYILSQGRGCQQYNSWFDCVHVFSKQECNSQKNSSDDSHETKQMDDTLKTPPQVDSHENKQVDDTLKTPTEDGAIVRNDNSEIVDPYCTTNSSIIEKELIFISFLCML